MDADFFAAFNKDLRDPTLWKQFHERSQQTKTKESPNAPVSIPPLPDLDAEFLFWEMMRISRTADPYMFPALQKLRESGDFVLGALSNTTIFPDGHPYNRDVSGVKSQFDFFISSAHSGLRKPDPKIYEVALREMDALGKKKGMKGVAPADVVFLDDIGQNLKGAKRAGMRTIKVNLGKTEDAVRELERVTGMTLLAGQDKARL